MIVEKRSSPFFLWRIPKSRGVRGKLLYGLMSWIVAAACEPDEARRILLEANDVTEVDRSKRNWEHLFNDRVRSFSNAGPRDEWYRPFLETLLESRQQLDAGNGRASRESYRESASERPWGPNPNQSSARRPYRFEKRLASRPPSSSDPLRNEKGPGLRLTSRNGSFASFRVRP